MKKINAMLSLAILGCFVVYANAHTYSLGNCPMVEPQSDFQMQRMLGLWYVIQKTSTGSTCITYNFTKTDEPEVYELEQVSQHFALGLTPLKHEYHYTGKLTVPDASIPAKMKVKFPLSVAGSAQYTVFATDYNTFAGIFTCQGLGFGHRKSATILSREKTLDKMYTDKLRNRLSSFNVDPYEMSIISQKDCPKVNSSEVYNINIDDETFSSQSVANVFRKAGEKIGDGVEYIAGGAKKVYHKISDSVDDSKEDTTTRARVEAANPYAEWLP
jgi:apolipoprotein D and lipocalin family protein